jgi:hypothetical protein
MDFSTKQDAFEQEKSEKFKLLCDTSEERLNEVLTNKRNCAMTRGFLYICKCQNDAIEQLEGILADTLISDGGFGGIMAVGFLGQVNKNSVLATKTEVAVLFSMLEQKFEGKDKFRISVDYGPDGGPVRDVLMEWVGWVKEERQKESDSTGEKVKKLPAGLGLPCKSAISVEDGCANVGYSKIIDDHGNTLRENPHETAYKTESEEDIEMAFHLQPNRPQEWIEKFINRDIAVKMNYTFEGDALSLCKTENYGVLSYLFENVSEEDLKTQHMIKIGFEILKCLCVCHGVQASIVNKLFEKGLPIINFDGGYMSSSDPIFQLIKSMDECDLEKLLKIISCPQNISIYNLERIKKNLIWAITIRYTKHSFDSRKFAKILEFWGYLHLKDEETLYNIDEYLTKTWNLQICKGVMELANDRNFEFQSKDCESEILEIIKEYEKSPEADKFDNVIPEVNSFPSYYSGCSYDNLRTYARPVFKRLNEAFNSLSEEEQVDRKTTYERATTLLENTIEKGGNGCFF